MSIQVNTWYEKNFYQNILLYNNTLVSPIIEVIFDKKANCKKIMEQLILSQSYINWYQFQTASGEVEHKNVFMCPGRFAVIFPNCSFILPSLEQSFI